jgi:hypothetical protein
LKKNSKTQRRNILAKEYKFSNNVLISNNAKLPQNKSKRYELDKKFIFTIDTMTKDYINKLKGKSKMILCDKLNSKLLSNDFKKQVEALKAMKNNLDQRENINLFL